MATAIRYDTTAWATFTVLEAKRILAFLGLSASGGLEALERLRCGCTGLSTLKR